MEHYYLVSANLKYTVNTIETPETKTVEEKTELYSAVISYSGIINNYSPEVIKEFVKKIYTHFIDSGEYAAVEITNIKIKLASITYIGGKTKQEAVRINRALNYEVTEATPIEPSEEPEEPTEPPVESGDGTEGGEEEGDGKDSETQPSQA